MNDQISQLLIVETRRRLKDESLERIKKCLSLLSDSQIWHKQNQNSNSVGNLVLHLCGNIRQWIMSGLGKQEDNRNRPLEFSEKGAISKEILIQKFEDTINEVERVLDKLTADDLAKEHEVQIYKENGVAILMHVVEHCSYHVGQITTQTKFILDVDTEYYAGEDLG